MESKKINQLATELAPDLSDLTIIGNPTTGISKKITLSQMASLFTGTVEEYANFAAFPLVGVADTIYIALDTNIIYRWNTGTSAYVELSPNIVSSLMFNDANGFDGTINLVGSVATLTITTALTTGSVGFIGASGALLQDNANFFWDDTNNRLGLGTNAPTTALDVFGSGIIGRINGTSTNNAFLGFASAGTNKWSIGNVQSDHRFRIYNEATTSELVSVLSTGEFGIGIANPTTKFHIDGAASALIANLDANVSVAKSISFRSDNSNRINLEVSGTESGSNVGADFQIKRFSDAGALIDTPLTITRSTGAISLATTLNLSEIQASTSAGITLKSNGGTSIALFGAGGGAGTTLYGGLIGTSASFSSTATATSFIPSGATVPTNGMYLSAANTLNFATNSTNRLSISSTGVSTFTANVAIEKAAAILLLGNSTTNSYGVVQFLGNASGQGNTLGEFDFYNKVSGTDVLSGQIEIAHDSSSANSKSYMALRVHNGTSLLTPLYISSDGVLDLAIGQIKFPATQNASSNANTLDDYEEGTFTPTVSFSTSGTVTYYLRLGTYTKIGRQVTVNLMVNFSDNTGSGNVSIGNLPFTSNSTTNYRLAGSILGAGMTGLVGGLTVYMGAASTTLDILQTNGGVYAGTFVTNANTSTDTDFSIGITYFTS
jgi:hypothetical protein